MTKQTKLTEAQEKTFNRIAFECSKYDGFIFIHTIYGTMGTLNGLAKKGLIILRYGNSRHVMLTDAGRAAYAATLESE